MQIIDAEMIIKKLCKIHFKEIVPENITFKLTKDYVYAGSRRILGIWKFTKKGAVIQIDERHLKRTTEKELTKKLAHELAHIKLHSSLKHKYGNDKELDKKIEKEANQEAEKCLKKLT